MKQLKKNQKIFLLSEGEEEIVWGKKVSENNYLISSIPFLAYNVSHQDILGSNSNREGIPVVDQVIKKSGHRTIRVILNEASGVDEIARAVSDEFIKMDCGVESMDSILLAVDIPPAVDIQKVAKYCIESKFDWEYGDPQNEC